MHYMNHRFPTDEKYKFHVIFPGAIFMEGALGPPEHEKYWVNVSWPGCTGMHYVTRRPHWMQKHKFAVMCPGALFMRTAPGPPKHDI
jgi:hypothetical protein